MIAKELRESFLHATQEAKRLRHEYLTLEHLLLALTRDARTREVLKEVFHKSETDAVQIMLHVHYNGIGVAGVYPYEVAETKIRLTEKLARENEFPLRLSMEPEDD